MGPSPAEELLQHCVGDRRGQDSDPDREQFPSPRDREGGENKNRTLKLFR